MIQLFIMIQTTATIIAIVETQMMTVSIFYPLPAAYSHRQTNAPKNAATDTPNHSSDEATQHRRPLPHVRVRAAWWGWL